MNFVILALESAAACALFTALVVPSVLRDPLGWAASYPPAVRARLKAQGRWPVQGAGGGAAQWLRKGVSCLAMVVVLALAALLLNDATTLFWGFANAYVIWMAVTWFDTLALDLGWFCHSKRVRIPGTEDLDEAYGDGLYHLKSGALGTVLGIPVCLLAGWLVTVLAGALGLG